LSDSQLPSRPNRRATDSPSEAQPPEVRLELTRAGVQEVLSLYSREQRSTDHEPGVEFGLAEIGRAIRERRRILALGLIAGVALAGLVVSVSEPLYAVDAQVVLERHDMTRAESSGSIATAGSAFIATQTEVMRSRSVLAAAVESLPRAAHLAPEDDALSDAAAAVRASAVSGTQVIALGYLGPDAHYGMALLESIVEAYRGALRAHEITVQSEKLRAKRSEIEVLDSEAHHLEEGLATMRAENGTVGSAENAAEAQTSLLRDLARQLTEARNERIVLENRLATGSERLAILDPATQSLQDQLWAAEAELERTRLSLTPRHPAVETARREVAVLKRQLAASSTATPNALERDLEAARGLESQLGAVYEGERSRMAAIERERREESLLLAELERVRDLSDQRRSELLDQRLVTRLAETGETGIRARLIQPPSLPLAATWPRPRLLIAIGALSGLALGFLAALVSLQRERQNEMGRRDEPTTWASRAQANQETGIELS